MVFFGFSIVEQIAQARGPLLQNDPFVLAVVATAAKLATVATLLTINFSKMVVL